MERKGELHMIFDLERLDIPFFVTTDSKIPVPTNTSTYLVRLFPVHSSSGGFTWEAESHASIHDPTSGVEVGNIPVLFSDAVSPREARWDGIGLRLA